MQLTGQIFLLSVYLTIFLLGLFFLFISYKHLIFIKLLIGYSIIIMLMIPLAYGIVESYSMIAKTTETVIKPSQDLLAAWSNLRNHSQKILKMATKMESMSARETAYNKVLFDKLVPIFNQDREIFSKNHQIMLGTSLEALPLLQNEYLGAVKRLFELKQNNGSKLQFAEAEQQILSAQNDFDTLIQEDMAKIAENRLEIVGYGGKIANYASKIALLMLIPIILFAIFSSFFLAYQITRPILALKEITNKIANGDLSQVAEIQTKDEVGQLASNFNSMVEKLAEAKKKRDEFIGMAAHDLRNPLFVITQGSSLLSSESLSEKQNQLVQTIQKGSATMLGLLNEMLSVSELDSDVFHIEKREVILRDYFKDIYDFNILMAKKKEIEFNVHEDFETDVFFFDAPKISQVINNLLNNAFKFSKPHSKVDLYIRATIHELTVKVQDEAGGIPEAEQSKLFTKFARISVRPTGGETTHGLGLAICKDIVQAHGGKIGFEIIPNKGSIFYFTLQTIK